jgi:hypothetical protein
MSTGVIKKLKTTITQSLEPTETSKKSPLDFYDDNGRDILYKSKKFEWDEY